MFDLYLSSTRTSQILHIHWANNLTIQYPQQFTIQSEKTFVYFAQLTQLELGN